MKRYLSIEEVANILGVSVKTVYRLTQKRLISHTRIGGRIKFHPDHVKDYETNNTVKAHA